MAIRSYDFAYGRGRKQFSLDDSLVLKEIRTEDFAPMTDIRNPIGIGPLDERVKPGDTVCFICNDLTRVANSFDFMPVFLDEMNRLGVPDENMKIVFSLGTHRNMTHDEVVEAVGAEVASRVKMINSDCHVDQDFLYFGQTSRGTPVLINKNIWITSF